MHMWTRHILAPSGLIILCLLLMPANGLAVPLCTDHPDTQTYVCTDVFGPTAGPFSLTLTDFPRFYSGLVGTPGNHVLQSVEVDLTGNVYGSATVVNGNNTTPPTTSKRNIYQLDLISTITMQGPNIVDMQVLPIFSTGPFTLDPVDPPPSSVTKSGQGSPRSNAALFTGSDMNPYMGRGTYGFDFGVTGRNTFSADSLISMPSNTITTDGRVTVTYSYDTNFVPEPATLVLFGSALLGLGFWGRRAQGRKA